MRIVVAGAGVGGMYAAGLFAELGHEVTVYEKEECLEKMRYAWHDDANPQLLQEAGVPVPEGSYPKKDWTFVTPYEKAKTRLYQRPDLVDMSIDRKALNRVLYDRKGDAEVVFGATVRRAVCDGKKVVGAEIERNGKTETVACDLLIDAAGVFSSVRASLPKGMVSQVSKESVFFVSRTFYELKEGVPVPTDTNKVYMKHIGQKGISWVIVNEKEADILIGRVGALTAEEEKEALEDLRKNNPIVGETALGGEKLCKIPVRRPLAKSVADGYVALGDSGCLTVPMIGSGIATSLLAAKTLAETIGTAEEATVERLWQYQVKVYQAFGAKHAGVEIMKNWLLEVEPDDVTWFLSSGLLTNEDMQKVSVGQMMTMPPIDLLKKAVIGCKRPILLAKTAFMLLRSSRAKKVALQLPKRYEEEAVERWAKKYDGLYL